MEVYKSNVIKDLPPAHDVNAKETIEALLNTVSFQIPGCINNLGSFVEITAIEHFDAYCAYAENTHICFTTHNGESPGNKLQRDRSSTRTEDYEFNQLTGLKV